MRGESSSSSSSAFAKFSFYLCNCHDPNFPHMIVGMKVPVGLWYLTAGRPKSMRIIHSGPDRHEIGIKLRIATLPQSHAKFRQCALAWLASSLSMLYPPPKLYRSLFHAHSCLGVWPNTIVTASRLKREFTLNSLEADLAIEPLLQGGRA